MYRAPQKKEHNMSTDLTDKDLSPQKQQDCTVSYDIKQFTSIKCSCDWIAPDHKRVDIDISCVAFNKMG